MNTRFAVAVHILSFLQSQEGEPATSELIASSVGTNPALIRRLLMDLAQAGLTVGQRGAGGGAMLARPGDQITLFDVYRAVAADEHVIPIHPAPNIRCPFGRYINDALELRFHAAEQALFAELAGSTVADLARDVVRRQHRRRA